MVQELGETAQEMMKTDDQDVQNILNDRPTGHYWIVIHHKPINKQTKKGEQILVRLVKAYDTKPSNQLGTIVLEVKDGEIIGHDINLHDIPIDWERLASHLGHTENPLVQERPDIAGAYVYNQ